MCERLSSVIKERDPTWYWWLRWYASNERESKQCAHRWGGPRWATLCWGLARSWAACHGTQPHRYCICLIFFTQGTLVKYTYINATQCQANATWSTTSELTELPRNYHTTSVRFCNYAKRLSSYVCGSHKREIGACCWRSSVRWDPHWHAPIGDTICRPHQAHWSPHRDHYL